MVTEKQPDTGEREDTLDLVTRWALIGFAAIAAFGAVLRMFGAGGIPASDRLNETTLLYLGVAGALLILRQLKTFSMGQLKFEMIEKLRERQEKQEEKLADIALILPLLLADKQVKHMKNLFAGATESYQGNAALRAELRQLRSMGLVSKKSDSNIADIKDGMNVDLDDYVELTGLGRSWATRIQEIEAAEGKQKP